MNIINFLNGKKTYTLVALAAGVFILTNLGYISADVAQQLYTLLGIGSVGTIRSAIN